MKNYNLWVKENTEGMEFLEQFGDYEYYYSDIDGVDTVKQVPLEQVSYYHISEFYGEQACNIKALLESKEWLELDDFDEMNDQLQYALS